VTANLRIAIAGASTLRGKEVAAVLEERMAAAEVRLLDDAVAEGVLAEAGGEPLIIQGTDEESFAGVGFAFFTDGAEYTRRHWKQALEAGTTVIDLSGALRGEREAAPWIPALRGRLAPPRATTGKVFVAPSSPAIIACSLAAALKELSVERLAVIFFQPVSERGQAGVEELENQSVNLLSLKPITQEVYGAQVAFNMLGGYGAEGGETLAGVRAEIAASVTGYLDGRVPAPAIQVVQVPVFYGYTFAAFADFAALPAADRLDETLAAVGVKVVDAGAESPSSVNVAGESQILVARPEADVASARACWIWGAADNLRLAAANAVSIAETLRAS
jgi:aspartate-semialdehyde dehydrogenase